MLPLDSIEYMNQYTSINSIDDCIENKKFLKKLIRSVNIKNIILTAAEVPV